MYILLVGDLENIVEGYQIIDMHFCNIKVEFVGHDFIVISRISWSWFQGLPIEPRKGIIEPINFTWKGIDKSRRQDVNVGIIFRSEIFFRVFKMQKNYKNCEYYCSVEWI